MDWDKLPKIAAAGPSLGTIVELDRGGVGDAKALAYIPFVYMQKAQQLQAEQREQKRVVPISGGSPS